MFGRARRRALRREEEMALLGDAIAHLEGLHHEDRDWRRLNRYRARMKDLREEAFRASLHRPFHVQMVRGMFSMPYVGEHPGTAVTLMFGALPGMAGVQQGSLIGAIAGAVMGLMAIAPFYLWGCAERARLSDRLVAQRGPEPDVDAVRD